MTLLFEEKVRGAIREVLRFQLVEPDEVEFLAVGSVILQMALDRLYVDFDFPENWRNDPEAYGMFMQLVIHVLLGFGPPEHRAAAVEEIKATCEDIIVGKPYERPEPKTNREIEYRRRFDNYMSAEGERRPYNPARYGKVRAHTAEELNEYTWKAAGRAEHALRQWQAGVPLRDIAA